MAPFIVIQIYIHTVCFDVNVIHRNCKTPKTTNTTHSSFLNTVTITVLISFSVSPADTEDPDCS